MSIGILSKRKTMMTAKLKSYLKNKGFKVSIYTLENLAIDDSLLKHDFFILKSKNLFFLYAGYFLEANNIPVIPNPDVSLIQKNRIQSHFLMKKISLLCPEIYLGTSESLKTNLNEFPYILKPIMGSGSKGVRLIRSKEDLITYHNGILYVEKFINGIHYNVYFIGNEICTLVKPPLSNEHVDMKKIKTPDDIHKLIDKWKDSFKGNLLFGHLDIVREEFTDKLYVVDPGSFPEFTNWKCDGSPPEKICDLILEYVKKLYPTTNLN